MLKKSLMAAALIPLIAACDGTTGPNEQGQVAIRFGTSPSAQASSSAALFSHTGSGESLVVQGTNGTLVIQDIRLIVSEFELEAHEGACELAGNDDDDCPDFEAPPSLLSLPLGGGAVTVATGMVPAGTYSELEFEVEDLDLDDEDTDGDDATKRQAIQNILQEMRGAYPGFPSNASMVVHGTFTPTGGEAREFTVYFDAEIEVEMDLVPPVTIPGTETLTVLIDPALWFKQGAEVMDLSARDGQTLEFELEMENGFGRVEHDD